MNELFESGSLQKTGSYKKVVWGFVFLQSKPREEERKTESDLERFRKVSKSSQSKLLIKVEESREESRTLRTRKGERERRRLTYDGKEDGLRRRKKVREGRVTRKKGFLKKLCMFKT